MPLVPRSIPVLAALFLACGGSHFLASSCYGGDWPQILGPQRNGTAVDERPLKAWPAEGPPVNWSFPIGSGYAGPAVVGDRVIVFHRVGEIERVEAIELATGKSAWTADFPATYSGGYNSDTGPRCVPLVTGDRVVVFGAAGHLHAVKFSDGTPLWSRDTQADYPGPGSYFGAGSTPIVADNKVLLNVGGRDAGLVAFDLQTGKTVWKQTDERASYSSPTAARIDGQSQVIFVTRMHAMGIDPATGKELFRFPFGARGPTVNAASPLVFDDRLFVSAAYGVGGHLAKLTRNSAVQVWANDTTMSSQYSTCVHHDGHLYGTHGREDFANGELRCIEANTGQVKWTAPGFGVAHTILVGDHLLLWTNQGRLVLAPASPVGYQPLASAQLSNQITRALPAYSNGRFLFRDNQGNGGTLKCVTLVAP